VWIAQASASVFAKTVAIAASTGPFGVGVTFVVNSTQGGAFAMTASAQSATSVTIAAGYMRIVVLVAFAASWSFR
jgi:hypothetical protein